MRYKLKTEFDRQCARDTATDLAGMLKQLNTWDSIPLSAQFSRGHGNGGERCTDPESVYGMLRGALAATLALLGVPLESSAMDDAVQAMHDGCDIRDVIKTYAGEKG